MDDLIYNFLLRLGYPRASIVFDADLLEPIARAGSTSKVPAFVVVDPEEAYPLAVIDVVESLDFDSLKQVAEQVGAYANLLGGKLMQGFLIRLDSLGESEVEQVQFYRVLPNSALHQLSSKNFPDIDSLRVSRKLMTNSAAKAEDSAPGLEDKRSSPDTALLDDNAASKNRCKPSAALYVPAIVLVILAFADGIISTLFGVSLISISQSVLALGAAALLTLPAAI